jgi:hypothetical protein
MASESKAPEMPAELWMLWTGTRWVGDSSVGAMTHLACGSYEDAQGAALDLFKKSDIRCTPVRVDRPRIEEMGTFTAELREQAPKVPPLFELPNGEWLDPCEVTAIWLGEPVEEIKAIYQSKQEPRIIIYFGKGQFRNCLILPYATMQDAVEAARDLGQRINEARKG